MWMEFTEICAGDEDSIEIQWKVAPSFQRFYNIPGANTAGGEL